MNTYRMRTKFEQIRQVKLTSARLGLLRRCDKIELDRNREFEHDIRIFMKEARHEQCNNVSSPNRTDLERRQSRFTTIRANLWNARVSKA